MGIKVNGKLEHIKGLSIMELIEEKKLPKDSLVVEYNYNVLKSDKWDNTILKDGDNLELLSFVGGG